MVIITIHYFSKNVLNTLIAQVNHLQLNPFI